MRFLDKLKWILGILLVFILIITTNLIDKNNFTRVRDSVETIYEDRLIAKDLIYEINNAIHEKQIAVISMDSTFFSSRNKEINQNVEALIERYKQTKLTVRENEVFNDLMDKITKVKPLENATIEELSKNSYVKDITEIKECLKELSKIQLEEGSKQVSISQKALQTVELFTQIEIYLLVFLAIVIQIIVMYNPKEE